MSRPPPTQGVADGERTYRGLPGAFVYSFRTSPSLAYKSYAVVSALLTLVVIVFFAIGLIRAVAATLGASELVTFVRAFVIVVGVLVAAPIIAPVLLVARRHRTSGNEGRTYDTALALGGYAFVSSLYLGLLVSVPPAYREPAGSPFVRTMYALPEPLGVVPPLVGTALIVALHYRYR